MPLHPLRTLAVLALAGACALISVAATNAATPQTRIVNGGPAAGGADPVDRLAGTRWAAIAAIVKAGQPDEHQGQLCGGSLIAPTLVLTAAHCIEAAANDEPHELNVVTGRVRLNDDATGQRLAVARVVGHTSHGQHERNDVALLELATPSTSTPISIAARGEDALWGAGAGRTANEGDGPWIAGWGARCFPDSSPGCGYPTELHEVAVPLASDRVCGDTTRGGSEIFDRRTMLCGGVLDTDRSATSTNGRDACLGDSGGPLIIGDQAGGWRQVGITSWGYACASDTYGFYTRLATMRTWVDCQRSLGVGGAGGPAPLEGPRDLVARSVRAGSARLAFAAPSGGAAPGQYNIYLVSGGRERLVGVAYRRTYDLRKLAHRTSYTVLVRSAVDGCAQSAAAATVSFTTPPDRIAPTRPGAPMIRMRGRTAVTLSWRRSSDEFGVRRYRVEELQQGSWRTVARAPGRRPSTRITGLSPGSAHSYRVLAIDPHGNVSSASKASAVRTLF